MTVELPPYQMVASQEDFYTLMDELKQQSLIAVDTESNNLYAYQGRVSLIQISTRERDIIIDPLEIEDMQPFGEIMADQNIEKVFHAADYDLVCLKRDYNFELVNVFDTMIASRLCHHESFGLADVMNHYFDVQMDKRHQLDNWGKRPLPDESLHYAQMDTHFLPDLRDILYKKLVDLDRLEEAREAFNDVLAIEVKEGDFDPDGFWKIGLPRSLSRREMAILQQLYLLRDRIARKQDNPPFKVIGNKGLIRLARQQPKSMKALYQMSGISGHLVRRHGKEVLEAISVGKKVAPPTPPQQEQPDPIITERYIALHAWRKDQASERNLDSSLILPKQALWDIAYQMPQTKAELSEIRGIGEWRLSRYGDDLLSLVQTLI